MTRGAFSRHAPAIAGSQRCARPSTGWLRRTAGAPLSSLGQVEGDPDRVSGTPRPSRPEQDGLVELVPVVRRIIGARVRDPHLAEDLVQETLTRVVAARSRVEGDTLAPYAATTARNVVASHFRREDLAKRKAHLLAEDEAAAPPIDGMVDEEDRRLLGAALARLPAGERDLLVAHEVEGEDTRSLAAARDSTPGAVAAALSRGRAKLRVEYLLLRADLEPLTDRCRPIL